MESYKVMLVDDEAFIRARMRQMIHESGKPFTVVAEAESGYEALACMDRYEPHVVFTDIRMPRMDGLIFIREVRGRYPDMFISIVTGFERFEYAQQALRSRVNEFLVKPVSENVLHQVLGKAEEELGSLNRQQSERDKLIQSAAEGYFSRLLEKSSDSSRLGSQLQAAGVDIPAGAYRLVIADRLAVPMELLQARLAAPGPDRLPVWLLDQAQPLPVLPASGIRLGVSRLFILSANELEPLKKAYVQAIAALGGKWFASETALERTALEPEAPTAATNMQYERIRRMLRCAEEGQADEAYKLLEELFRDIRLEGQVEVAHLQQFVQIFHDRLLFVGGETLLADGETALSHVLICGSLHDLQVCMTKLISQLSAYLELRREQANPFVDKAIAFIHRHFNEDLSLAQISAVVALNPNYFSGLFKTVTGMNFKHYMTDYRIRKAKELLLEGCWKPSEVSFMVGYTDEKYFSRVFKKITGCAPHLFGKARKDFR